MENNTSSQIPLKNIIVSIIIAGIVLGFGTYLYFPEVFSKFFNATKKPEVKTELQLQQQVADIVATKDFSQCSKVSDAMYKVVCVNNIALNLAQETQDLSYCQKIDNALVPISDCERQIIFTKSVTKGDVSVCGETNDATIKEECIAGFWQAKAFNEGNTTLCENISNEFGKNYCYDNYLFSDKFQNNISGFDCRSFKDIQTQEDCKNYKKMPSQSVSCGELRSMLFSNYCSINDRKF
jgi:hypothetical protein